MSTMRNSVMMVGRPTRPTMDTERGQATFKIVVEDSVNKTCITEASIYWDMLCGVPPIYSNRDTFQVGEAHSHDHEGRPLYGTFTRRGEDYYFIGYLRCSTDEIEKAKQTLIKEEEA